MQDLCAVRQFYIEFYKWKNAIEAFNEHAKSSHHKGCTEPAENFLKVFRGEQLSVEPHFWSPSL